MKLSELLAQPTVELHHGDVLQAITRSEGYVQDRQGTDSLHKGKYRYKVLGIGEPDETTGKYESHKIVPIIMNKEGTAYEDDVENPIVVQEAGKVTYVTGRNHPAFKDAYNGKQYFEINVGAGDEHRVALIAFLAFVNSEFSLGVNDFQVDTPEKE